MRVSACLWGLLLLANDWAWAFTGTSTCRRGPVGRQRQGRDSVLMAGLGSDESALSRAQWLAGTASLLGGCLAIPSSLQAAEEATSPEQAPGEFSEFTAPDGGYAFLYPSSFQKYSKPLQTHLQEANFKSTSTRGYELGVAVDPVRIESLEKFGTPQEVGERVIKVELAKDGTLGATLLATFAEQPGQPEGGPGLSAPSESTAESPPPLYTLDYSVDSTRGAKHFLCKVGVSGGRLYVLTGQAKEADYPAVREELARAVRSFRVPP